MESRDFSANETQSSIGGLETPGSKLLKMSDSSDGLLHLVPFKKIFVEPHR